MIYGEMEHPGHPGHKLQLEHESRPFICDGCKELGFYTRYACAEPGCNFHLHDCCAERQATFSHPFFPKCDFQFLEAGETGRICDACGKDITGYVYHCFGCGNDLHPCCATLPRVLEPGGELKLLLHRKVKSECYRCGKKDLKRGKRSWSYVSEDKESHFHLACVAEMLAESWKKVFLASQREDEVGVNESKEIQPWVPKLQMTLRKDGDGKKKNGRFQRLKKVMKIALTFIVAALVGDPTAMVAALIASLVAH